MSISQLFIIAAIAFLVGQIKKGRPLVLLGMSAFLIYWLQPVQDNITLTFWLPTTTLIVTVLTWLLTSTPEVRGWKENLPAEIVLLGVILLLDLNRYFHLEGIFITTTPRPQWVIALFMVVIISVVLLTRLKEFPPILFVLAVFSLILIFVLVKAPSILNLFLTIASALHGKE